MATRPIAPPRRDEIALGGAGAFSRRVITYLEDIADLTNETPDLVLDDVLSFLGGLSNAGILEAEQSKITAGIENTVSLLTWVMAENSRLRAELIKTIETLNDLTQQTVSNENILAQVDNNTNDIQDLKQLVGGI